MLLARNLWANSSALSPDHGVADAIHRKNTILDSQQYEQTIQPIALR